MDFSSEFNEPISKNNAVDNSQTNQRLVICKPKFNKKVSPEINLRRDNINRLNRVLERDIESYKKCYSDISLIPKSNRNLHSIVLQRKIYIEAILKVLNKIKKNLRKLFCVCFEAKSIGKITRRKVRLNHQLELAINSFEYWINLNRIFCEHSSNQSCIVCLQPGIEYKKSPYLERLTQIQG